MSPEQQAQRLREIAQQHDDGTDNTGEQIVEAAPIVAVPDGEQVPEPDLDADARRIVMSSRLPSPLTRALSPHDDPMTGRTRVEGSQASVSENDPVASMSALADDLAAVIDDDIVSDLGRDEDPDEASSFGGRSASNLSRALVGQTLTQVEVLGKLRMKVREGDDRPEDRLRCFDEWKLTGACINFDVMADSQIHHLVNATMSNAGYDDTTTGAAGLLDNVSLNDKRQWLWKAAFGDFACAARTTPLNDQPAESFQELYLRNKAAGVDPGKAISMTLFTQQKDPSCVEIEELMWTIFVFSHAFEAVEVLTMDRASLCSAYQQLAITYPHDARDNVRWVMGGESVDMIMDELDIVDCSLTRLLGFYDRKNARGCLSVEEQAQSEPYHKDASVIVPLIEAGGNEGPQQTQPSRRSTTPARKRSLSAKWPRASARRARHAATPKRNGRGVDALVTLESSGDDQETRIVARRESENEDIDSAQEPDDPDRYLRRSQGSPEPSGVALETPGHPDETVAGETPPGRLDNLEQFQLDEAVRLSA
jgi:hypothetical protein